MSVAASFVVVLGGILLLAVALYEKRIKWLRLELKKRKFIASNAEFKAGLLEKEIGERVKVYDIQEQIIGKYKERVAIMEAHEEARKERVRAIKRRSAAKARAKKKEAGK